MSANLPVHHQTEASLCVLLLDTIAFPTGCHESGVVCHWYASTPSGHQAHEASEVFVPSDTGDAVKLAWCVFLVVDASADVNVQLTVSTLDGSHLGVYFGNVSDLAVGEQFDVGEVTLKNVEGAYANAVVHAAKQVRWFHTDDKQHELGSVEFQEAAKDAQSKLIYQFLFPNKALQPADNRSRLSAARASQLDTVHEVSEEEADTSHASVHQLSTRTSSPEVPSPEVDLIGDAIQDEPPQAQWHHERELETARESEVDARQAREAAAAAAEARARAAREDERDQEEQRRREAAEIAAAAAADEERRRRLSEDLKAEERRRAEQEARDLAVQREIEQARRRSEELRREAEEAQRRADEEARRMEAQEAQRQLQEEREAQRRAEEEARRRVAEETAWRQQQEMSRAAVVQEATSGMQPRRSRIGRTSVKRPTMEDAGRATYRHSPSTTYGVEVARSPSTAVHSTSTGSLNRESSMGYNSNHRSLSRRSATPTPVRSSTSPTRRRSSLSRRTTQDASGATGVPPAETRQMRSMVVHQPQPGPGSAPARSRAALPTTNRKSASPSTRMPEKPPVTPWDEQKRLHLTSQGPEEHYGSGGDRNMLLSARSDESEVWNNADEEPSERVAALRSIMRASLREPPVPQQGGCALQSVASSPDFSDGFSKVHAPIATSSSPPQQPQQQHPLLEEKIDIRTPWMPPLAEAPTAGHCASSPASNHIRPTVSASTSPQPVHVVERAVGPTTPSPPHSPDRHALAGGLVASTSDLPSDSLQVFGRSKDSAHASAASSAGSTNSSHRRLYRVLTPAIAVRVGPDVASARTGYVLQRGDLFEASVVAPGVDGRTYLKLAGARGWVFDDAAVDPADPSVEPVSEEEWSARPQGRLGSPSRHRYAAPTQAAQLPCSCHRQLTHQTWQSQSVVASNTLSVSSWSPSSTWQRPPAEHAGFAEALDPAWSTAGGNPCSQMPRADHGAAVGGCSGPVVSEAFLAAMCGLPSMRARQPAARAA
mmetsp:Transcript_65790/g.122686  ORF Transcript_65790/g.122686 Transcript_65790/m.122686 type:complete len:1000 (-) Transcript_65790:62-3061(-)